MTFKQISVEAWFGLEERSLTLLVRLLLPLLVFLHWLLTRGGLPLGLSGGKRIRRVVLA